MLKKSAPVAQNVSPEGLPIYPTSADVYKVKDLIHNTQEHDKVLLGLEGQTRFRVEEEERNLLGVHNLTEANLAHAVKMGGIANQ